MSKPIVVACSMDASFGGSLTPSPWHTDAVGGRPPHHPTRPIFGGRRWVRFGDMKSRSRCEGGRPPLGTIGRGPARGACRGARVVLRLREPNLRPEGPAQPWL